MELLKLWQKQTSSYWEKNKKQNAYPQKLERKENLKETSKQTYSKCSK